MGDGNFYPPSERLQAGWVSLPAHEEDGPEQDGGP
jgi:hypothetical protein